MPKLPKPVKASKVRRSTAARARMRQTDYDRQGRALVLGLLSTGDAEQERPSALLRRGYDLAAELEDLSTQEMVDVIETALGQRPGAGALLGLPQPGVEEQRARAMRICDWVLAKWQLMHARKANESPAAHATRLKGAALARRREEQAVGFVVALESVDQAFRELDVERVIRRLDNARENKADHTLLLELCDDAGAWPKLNAEALRSTRRKKATTR